MPRMPADAFLLVRDDPSQRRGIWSVQEENKLTLFGGREGEDVTVNLTVGAVITPEMLKQLYDVLISGCAPGIDYGDEIEYKGHTLSRCCNGGCNNCNPEIA